MSSRFKNVEKKLDKILKEMLNGPYLTRDQLKGVPKQGVYVFFERNKPIYVGRSNRLKARLLEHGRPSSTHNSAPFAFNIAKLRAKNEGLDINKNRIELEKSHYFEKPFTKAKERVSKMKIKCVAVDDQVTQALFEVYAAIELGTTKYNDFNTH